MELIVRHRGEERHLWLEGKGGRFRVEIGDRSYEVDYLETSGVTRSLRVGARQYDVAVGHTADGEYEIQTADGLERVRVLDRLTHLAETAHGEAAASGVDRVTAYMPGRVVELLVEEGEAVEAGSGVLVLEAMKMENEIRADRDGVIRKFFVAAGQAVEGGDPLYEIE